MYYCTLDDVTSFVQITAVAMVPVLCIFAGAVGIILWKTQFSPLRLSLAGFVGILLIAAVRIVAWVVLHRLNRSAFFDAAPVTLITIEVLHAVVVGVMFVGLLTASARLHRTWRPPSQQMNSLLVPSGDQTPHQRNKQNPDIQLPGTMLSLEGVALLFFLPLFALTSHVVLTTYGPSFPVAMLMLLLRTAPFTTCCAGLIASLVNVNVSKWFWFSALGFLICGCIPIVTWHYVETKLYAHWDDKEVLLAEMNALCWAFGGSLVMMGLWKTAATNCAGQEGISCSATVESPVTSERQIEASHDIRK